MGASVIAIIGARLNSSRLPRKHLLPLHNNTMIGHIINRLKTIDLIDEIVITTTGDAYNQDLISGARKHNVGSFAYLGDVTDLVGRVDAVVTTYDCDKVLYICGDCPLICPETITKMITAMEEQPRCDTVGLSPAQDGKTWVHEGFMLYRRSYWSRMVNLATTDFEREHIGAVASYSHKLKPQNPVNIEINEIFCDHELRISLDTRSDYRFLSDVYQAWYSENPDDSIVDLKWVMQQTKKNGSIIPRNLHVHQKAVEEKASKVALLTCAGRSWGLGNLKRTIIAAAALQDELAVSVMIYLVTEGEGREKSFVSDTELNFFPHEHISSSKLNSIKMDADLLVVDMPDQIWDLCKSFIPSDMQKIGMDRLAYAPDFASGYIPSFYADKEKRTCEHIRYGWDAYLLPDVTPLKLRTNASQTEGAERTQKSLLVLSGGSDPSNVSAWLPKCLIDHLPHGWCIEWVKGPWANKPVVNHINASVFNIVEGADNLMPIIQQADAVFCLYGVSFFEALAAGKAIIVMDPLGAAMKEEWASLKTENIAEIIDCKSEIPMAMRKILNGHYSTVNRQEKATQLALGRLTFANFIKQCLAIEAER